MFLTDYYKGQKLTYSLYRYDIVASTGEYDYFENLLINKRGFNIGGQSFNLVGRPERWKGTKTDLAITKNNHNITSVKMPNLESNYGYGDINGTRDGCIIVFNPDYRSAGIHTVEIFIARGCKNFMITAWSDIVNGDLMYEFDALRQKAVTKNVTNTPNLLYK